MKGIVTTRVRNILVRARVHTTMVGSSTEVTVPLESQAPPTATVAARCQVHIRTNDPIHIYILSKGHVGCMCYFVWDERKKDAATSDVLAEKYVSTFRSNGHPPKCRRRYRRLAKDYGIVYIIIIVGISVDRDCYIYIYYTTVRVIYTCESIIVAVIRFRFYYSVFRLSDATMEIDAGLI